MSFSSLTPSDYIYALLCSFTICFSFCIITVGIPVLPQYFRDANIYQSQRVYENVTLGNRTTAIVKTVYENEAVYNGILFASYGTVQIFAQPLFGLIMKRIRPRLVLMFVLPLFVLTAMLFAFCDTYATLLASRSLQGLVGAGIKLCSFTIMVERFTDKVRLSVLSLQGIIFVLSTRIVPAAAGGVYDMYGKTIVFLGLACVAAIINVAWIALYICEINGFVEKKTTSDENRALLEKSLEKENPLDYNTNSNKDVQNSMQMTSKPVPYSVLLTSVTPLMLSLVEALTYLPYTMMTPLLSNRMHELVPNATQFHIGLLLPCAIAGVAVSWLAMHNITHRSWYSHMYPITAMSAALALACIIAALAQNFWQMWLSLSLMEGVHFTSIVASYGMMCEYVTRRCSSSNSVTAFSIMFIADNVGSICGLVGGGVAVQYIGYTEAWMGLGFMYILTTAAMSVWIRYEQKQSIRL